MATSQAANSTGTVQTPRPGMGGRTLVLFFALAFGLAWGLIALLLLFTAQIKAVFGPVGYANPLFVLAVWSPGIVGDVPGSLARWNPEGHGGT